MKSYLSLTLMTLLLACGESRINSVDDKILDEAQAEKAAADLKEQQTAVLGTWRACAKTSDVTSTRFDYAFTSDGVASLNKLDYGTADCSEEAVAAVDLKADWTLVPVPESKNFKLLLKWSDGKKLETEYRLAGNKADLPKFFELKDQTDLGLVELKDKDKFVTLSKVSPDELEDLRRKSEDMIKEYARSLLSRDGEWNSICADSKMTTLQFKVGKSISLTSTSGVYEDKDCKKLKEDESESKTVNFTMVSVPDLKQKKVVLDTGKAKGTLKVSFEKIDLIELSDLINGKDNVTLYKYSAAGDAS